MNHPAAYWLLYIPEPSENGPLEVAAIMPGFVDRTGLSDGARRVLGAAHAYHLEHGEERAVFFAEITCWIERDKHLTWHELDVDFEAALADLDARAPVMYLEVDPLTYWVVADASTDGVAGVVPHSGETRKVDKTEAKSAVLGVLDRALAEAAT